jgi:hypothetical protein
MDTAIERMNSVLDDVEKYNERWGWKIWEQIVIKKKCLN